MLMLANNILSVFVIAFGVMGLITVFVKLYVDFKHSPR